jgi:hypothetical protein
MLCIGKHSCFDQEHSWQTSGATKLIIHSCAAKSKSSKALRDDRALYEQLSMAAVFTTSQITTSLVYSRASGPLSILSDRSFIHHSVTDGKLMIYVPADASQRKVCYRSQLPKLLATILNADDASGVLNVSKILSTDLREMDDIMVEQDIKHVGWIAKPTLQVPLTADEEEPWVSAQASHAAVSFDRVSTFDGSDTATLADPLPRSLTPGTAPAHYARTIYNVIPEEPFETVSPSQYPELIEMVVRSAQRAEARYLGDEDAEDEDYQHFDYVRTFGSHEQIAWRRIGAAGEAYVSVPPIHLVHY